MMKFSLPGALKQIEEVSLGVERKSNRIVAFDIIRGVFLAVILVDHIELYPSGFDILTGRGRWYVSAAEGFFFMSGLLVGLVYKRRLKFGLRFIFKKMWLRALELYAASVVLTLLFMTIAIWLKQSSLKYGLPPSPVQWWHVIGQTLLMRYGYGWTDFLDRFALLMLLAPIGFYFLSRGRWKLLVALSFAAWCFRGVFSPYDFTISWQFLFMGAMIIGYHWQQLTSWFHRQSARRKRNTKLFIAWVGGITFLISYASVFLLTALDNHYSQLSQGYQNFTVKFNNFNAWVWLYDQKWTLGPIRIVLFLLWFSALFMVVQKYQTLIHKWTKGVFDLLGSNSLFVYIAQGFIVFIFKLVIPPRTNFYQNFLITLAGLILLIVVTVMYKKHYHVLTSKKAHLYQKLPWVPANVES